MINVKKRVRDKKKGQSRIRKKNETACKHGTKEINTGIKETSRGCVVPYLG